MLAGQPCLRHKPIYRHEKNLPAFQTHAQTPARLPCPHEDQRGASHLVPPAPARPQASVAQRRGNPLRASHGRLSGGLPIFAGPMGALTLPKAARLSRRAEFDQVRRDGSSWHGRLLVLGGWLSGSAEPPRLGVITAGRTGSAVERARLRRRVREIFRQQRPFLPRGLWMVVVLRRAAAGAAFAALFEEWRTLSVRAGFLTS